MKLEMVLPEDLSQWRHEDPPVALRKKISDIEAMEVKLAQIKAHLLTVIQLIGSKLKRSHAATKESEKPAPGTGLATLNVLSPSLT